MSSGDAQDWNEYKREVLAGLQRGEDAAKGLSLKLDSYNTTLMTKITALEIEMSILKTKAVMFGAGAGFAIGIISNVVIYLITKK